MSKGVGDVWCVKIKQYPKISKLATVLALGGYLLPNASTARDHTLGELHSDTNTHRRVTTLAQIGNLINPAIFCTVWVDWSPRE